MTAGSGSADQFAVMTGATSGIGLVAARALLDANPRLHLVVSAHRDRDDADVRRAFGAHASRLSIRRLDLASLDSVRRFTAEVSATVGDRLVAVFANAGVQHPDAGRTSADGYESTFAVNVLGHFALLRGLDVTNRSIRVVLTASGTHHDLARYRLGFPRPEWRDPEELLRPRAAGGASRDGAIAYSTSKLAVVYLGHELARRMTEGGSVVIHDPGLVPGTGLAREMGPAARFVFRRIAPALRVLPTVTSPGRAGQNLARLLDTTGDGPYVALTTTTRSSRESYDPARESQLWTTLDDVVSTAWSQK